MEVVLGLYKNCLRIVYKVHQFGKMLVHFGDGFLTVALLFDL